MDYLLQLEFVYDVGTDLRLLLEGFERLGEILLTEKLEDKADY